MNRNEGPGKNTESWNLKTWVWVLLCSAAIFSTVPSARGFQKFVYSTAGRELFMYVTLSAICGACAAALYFLACKLRVSKFRQYMWVLVCASSYSYITWRLRPYPEEALHLVEYALLSFFIFRAFAHRIRDWSVYITTILMVAFIGTVEEFIQWIIPSRYWTFRDIGINMLGGGILQLAIWKGVRPEIIRKPLKKFSVKMLAAVLTADLVLLTLCLSNTPQAVSHYTDVFQGLSWLRTEEPMSEFGPPLITWTLLFISLIVVWISAVKWMRRLQ
ncbi:MAG: VanZ family protein [Nitrospirae bacterium]|nr:VanZ family protein [Nitrospirota bacterium]